MSEKKLQSKGFKTFYYTYYTNYSIKDTIGLLKRKNMYDTLTYELEITEQGMFIIFTGANTHWCRNIHSKYEITFSRMEEGTRVSLNYTNSMLMFLFQVLPDKWMDEFMDKKLDAKRCRLDDKPSCVVDREEKVKKVCIAIVIVFMTVWVGLAAAILLSVF